MPLRTPRHLGTVVLALRVRVRSGVEHGRILRLVRAQPSMLKGPSRSLLSAAAPLVAGCSTGARERQGATLPTSAHSTTSPVTTSPFTAAASTTTSESTTPCGTGSAPRQYRHVIWIWMENHQRDQVIGDREAPFESALARECGTGAHYSAVGSPSLPNYLAATSGSTQGVHDDGSPTRHPVDADNLFRQVRAGGGTARTYAEAMPAPCALQSSGRLRGQAQSRRLLRRRRRPASVHSRRRSSRHARHGALVQDLAAGTSRRSRCRARSSVTTRMTAASPTATGGWQPGLACSSPTRRTASTRRPCSSCGTNRHRCRSSPSHLRPSGSDRERARRPLQPPAYDRGLLASTPTSAPRTRRRAFDRRSGCRRTIRGG